MIEWKGVQKEEIDQIWPQVEPSLREIIEKTNFPQGKKTSEMIKEELKEGKLQLWVFHQGKQILMRFVTEIVEKNGIKYLLLELLAGKNFKEVFPYLEIVGYWGIRCGARRIRANPRPAIRKALMEKWNFYPVENGRIELDVEKITK